MRNLLLIASIVFLSFLNSEMVFAENNGDLCIALFNADKNPVQFSPGMGDEKIYIVQPNQHVTLSRRDMKMACPYTPTSCYVDISSPGENNYRTIFNLSRGSRIIYKGWDGNQHYYDINPRATVPCVS
ncbi:MAG: hypothetical protein K0S27_1440 [Gammaproteobacteria bacterium]|jgi:hypothetical protein|nr:hypothetical protein [Gammaproteobacteria bacterium]